MKFLVITFAPYIKKDDGIYSYGPYVKEMDLWFKNVDEVGLCSPQWPHEGDMLISKYKGDNNFKLFITQDFDFTTPKKFAKAIIQLPGVVLQIIKAMRWADHIHFRCPTNIGVLALLVQIFFPKKTKTAKYAGNWDWNSKQPKSYRFQQWMLRNTFLTKNMTAIVYGSWPDRNKNILPFFTASYTNAEKIPTPPRALNTEIKLFYAGVFIPSKAPIVSIKVCEALNKQGIACHLDMFGDGSEKAACQQYVAENNLSNFITIHGNKPADVLKSYLQKAHFLVFISKSEGWPKVVAESMFWGCVPITTAVSCVPEMVGNGTRGKLVTNNQAEIIAAINHYINHPLEYEAASAAGMEWSRTYTLDKFENDIKKILDGTLKSTTNSR
jgi:glycosyltransferase involved in cell wall biosynthesis